MKIAAAIHDLMFSSKVNAAAQGKKILWMPRGARVSEPCDRALVVLRWLERERRWIVLTSYPETGR